MIKELREGKEAIGRCITKNNIYTNIKLLNLRSDLDSEEKFNHILKNCDEELGEEIIKKNITNWKELGRNYEEAEDDLKSLVEVCSEQRARSEPPEVFLERKMKEFLKFKVPEETALRWVANHLWPGNLDFSLKLLQHKNIYDFKTQLSYILEFIDKKKNKLWCENCKMSNHKTEKCYFNKQDKQ